MNPTPQVETLTSTQTPAGEEVALEMQGIKQDNASLRRQVQLLRVEVGRRWRGYGGTHPPCGMERVAFAHPPPLLLIRAVTYGCVPVNLLSINQYPTHPSLTLPHTPSHSL